jgi:hypothetical protein
MDEKSVIDAYLNASEREPEIPFIIIPTTEDVSCEGDFDFAVLAQSPNYTPPNADYILE